MTKQWIALGSLVFSLCAHASGNYFDVNALGTALSIHTTTSGHTYSTTGIQINTPGYRVNNVVCQQNSNGMCVFPVMSTFLAPSLELDGPTGPVNLTLCLNAIGPVSCQKYTVNVHKLHLAFVTQPSNTTPKGIGMTSASVRVLDEANQPYVSSLPVSLSIAHQANSDIYQGNLAGTTTVTTSNGVATFTDLTISQIGTGYTLSATVPNSYGITAATSAAFNVTGSTSGYTYQGSTADGFEITYIGNLGALYTGIMPVYIDYGSNPIDAAGFASFNEPNYVKNSTRQPIFDYTNTQGSPSAVSGPLITSTIGGYTWGAIADIQSFDWPFNASNYASPQPSSGWQAGAASSTVPAGVVKYSNINKNQLTIYTTVDPDNHPILRYFLEDPWANRYMMDATNAENTTSAEIAAAFNAAVLPNGWSKSTAYLSQDLYVNPAYGATNNLIASILKVRDNVENTYVQLIWGEAGDSLAQQIGSPMPLWTGVADTRINGTTGNDTIYGSSGNDRFYPDEGNDVIDGGAGYNGLFLPHSASAYSFSQANGVTSITQGNQTKSLTRIQYLSFSDGYRVSLL